MPPSSSTGTTNVPPVNPAEIDRNRLARALEDAMLRNDLTQADMAAAVGVTQQAASDWLGARKTPSKKNLEKILSLLDLGWDEIRRPNRSQQATDTASADVVRVPRAVPDAGRDRTESQTDPYPRMELTRITGASPDDLFSITVVGDSLSDEIAPNTRVLYRPVEGHVGDGLYVLDIDGVRVVKQIQRLGGGAFDVIPRNELYQRERFIPLGDGTDHAYRSDLTELSSVIRFVGKVVYYPKPA